MTLRRAAALFAALMIGGCGFQPLYATREGGGSESLGAMNLAKVVAPEAIAPILQRAFERRTSQDALGAPYELEIVAGEQAERLAVQIDASVTRYNYRLVASYTLIERASKKRYTGQVTSIASFNVVDSQYSTLYAEESAKEKAAAQLVEDIERDILLKFAADKDAQ